MTLGQAAEFIVENVSPQLNPPTTAFTDFTPTLRMTGSARSSGVFVLDPAYPYTQNISSDPQVFMLTDWTNTTTRLQVTFGPRDSTCCPIQPRVIGGGLGWPKVNCPSTPLPSGKFHIVPERRDEIVAVILFGIIHDEGGLYFLGKTLKRVPPRGPVTETLASLPPELERRLSPLLRELPQDTEAANKLAGQLAGVIASYRAEKHLPQPQTIKVD